MMRNLSIQCNSTLYDKIGDFSLSEKALHFYGLQIGKYHTSSFILICRRFDQSFSAYQDVDKYPNIISLHQINLKAVDTIVVAYKFSLRYSFSLKT